MMETKDIQLNSVKKEQIYTTTTATKKQTPGSPRFSPDDLSLFCSFSYVFSSYPNRSLLASLRCIRDNTSPRVHQAALGFQRRP